MSLQAWAAIGLALAAILVSSSYRRGIMRMMRSRTLLSDPDGHLINLLCDRAWVAKFSESFTQNYGATWAVGWKTDRVRYFGGKGHGADHDGR